MSQDLEQIKRAMDEADCLADDATVEAALDSMAEAITARLADRNPLVYAVMNGGLIFAGRILPRLPFPLEVAYLHATRYGHALQGTLLDWRVRPTQDLRDRTVLVLDDILDEGHTLKAIIEHLKEEGAAEVLSAVLVHKLHDRKASPGMRADFSGLDIADRFLFGCGMDYKGYWRNAPGIYAVKGL
ncbi:MAG: hypoxanthine-guanine phosphoribosyltransferase [Thauera propionica]|jgi:hypoxanthine phosphoribosyltransferase|uniref:Hypoxanthine-guanine phosphoribosyltransferase n=1 Tax=Thauera propionica TaxID=2019431 RepID=A0A235F1T1_9RHOO|nr:hypoxanthine-guanine phosphoribosyltransferase [Thauera propionica]MDD3674673.1 hypoxanthine-guanine phosphoribosyltransferase [Thauera propionica]MDY0046581.1 hypoxanthine-guanine phosphoribosyltransferase [Thauera propionica]OYD55240.1 hypoxanthine-guanine phosphoribosyltransferase [Thauera propionica]